MNHQIAARLSEGRCDNSFFSTAPAIRMAIAG